MVFGGTLRGDLTDNGIKSPWAEEGVNALVGFEYREDTLFEQADGTAAGGGLVGAGGATLPINARTGLTEFFGEIQIPVVAGLPGVEQFNLNGAYRWSEYSSEDILLGGSGGNFTTNTFSVGAGWVPFDDLRIRGQFQRAVRGPNINELFAQQNTGLTNLTDPCAGAAPTATLAECLNTGLTAAQFGNIPADSGQLNTLTGGNPGLSPEESDTFTLGFVYQPSFVEGLTLSADYFDITLDDAISTVPTATTLEQCLAGAQAFCDLIQRGPDGTLTFFPSDQAFIQATDVNIAEFATSGIDFQVLYNRDIGSLSLIHI